jgi:glutathione synthase/RimK-type ligase-like ATP-grasp enzyme
MGANSVNASSFAKQILNANKQVCSKPITNTKVLIEGEEHVRFTELLAPDAIHSLESLETCPVIFQEYIPKSYEIRVTVIGEQIFAARIDSQAGGGATSIDWRRYDIPKTPHSAYELPRVVRDQILALHRQLSLIYSSFDFVRTPCGEYVFLETNPFGQWLWIEDLTGLPISKAIADFLAAPSK